MRILAHFRTLRSEPEGVWWWDPSRGYQRYYTEGSDLERQGRLTFSRLLPDVAWDDVADHLEGQHGYFDVWASLQVPDGTEPAQMLRLAVLASKEA